MKVLLVNGSPNVHGCTYTALCEVEKILNEEGIETEIFWIGNKPLGGCMDCGKCAELKRCVLNDAVNVFAQKAMDADGFIFGAPVHFASVGANMRAFMDRLFYSEKGAFYMKPAAAVISARRSGTTAAFDQLNKYFTIRQMPIVSSRYWNNVHGSSPEDVLKDAEGLFTMRVLGRNMAYMLKAFEAAKSAGIPLPKREEPVRTDFIR